MKFFKPKYTVCEQCNVHFEPEPNDELGHFCKTCRIPIREKTNRKLRVVKWADANWEKLEEQVLKEIAEKQKENIISSALCAKMQQAMGINEQLKMSSLAAQQNIYPKGLYGL